MERLDVVIVGKDAVDLCLDEDVGDDRRQVICSDLLVQVEGIRLLDNLHDLLQLLKLAKRRLLLLEPACLLDGHFPGVPHRVIDVDTEAARVQLLEDGHLALELGLFIAQARVVKELGVQVIHDEVTDFNHIKVKLLLTSQELIPLQFASSNIKQFLE